MNDQHSNSSGIRTRIGNKRTSERLRKICRDSANDLVDNESEDEDFIPAGMKMQVHKGGRLKHHPLLYFVFLSHFYTYLLIRMKYF